MCKKKADHICKFVSGLMEHPGWMRVIDKEHGAEKVAMFEDWDASKDGT